MPGLLMWLVDHLLALRRPKSVTPVPEPSPEGGPESLEVRKIPPMVTTVTVTIEMR